MRLENPEKRGKRSEYSRQQNFKMLLSSASLRQITFRFSAGRPDGSHKMWGKKFEMRENEGFRIKNAGKMKEFYILIHQFFSFFLNFFPRIFFEFLPCKLQAKNLHIFAPIMAKNYL
jgi:hypothetical protein